VEDKNIYTVSTIFPCDMSIVIDIYTDAVFSILKKRVTADTIEALILKLKETPDKSDL
jgi:DNA topoisomerase VI subunit A